MYWNWFRGSTGINSPPFKMKIPGTKGSFDLFNIATNLVIGCDTTDSDPNKSIFQTKMTFGPMMSFTMPAAKHWDTQWKPTAVTEKYHSPIDDDASKEKFNREIEEIGQWDEYV